MADSDGPASNTINVAALCPSTAALGPGRRFVIWVQGCCFSCGECGSPEWREIRSATEMSPAELAARVLDVSGIEGLTISGGEPMLQADGLCEAVRIIRQRRKVSVICYTGFTLEDLQDQQQPITREFLSVIDVLIDGPYVDSLNDNKGWRGSSNQRVHFLSGVYQDREDEFLHRRRDIEIHLFGEDYLLVGIKPKEFAKDLRL